RIEARMEEIIAADQHFERLEVSRAEAEKIFRQLGENYKLEILAEIPPEESVTLYRTGEWVDLCRGPHVSRTGQIKAFKLLGTSGAYWRGDERNKMLQRIYGTSYPSQEQLQEYLHRLEEAQKRDHRRLGRKLDLFSISEEAGAGLILWHPQGGLIRKLIEDFWREEHLKAGYEIVYSPHIGRAQLWERSGHLDFYRENMYAPLEIEGQEYFLKPMNCPFHILIYKSKRRSYRELPLRWAELGTVYRYERSGVLHGLLRVRGFTQDDAHIFCRPDQVEEEILGCLDLTLHLLRSFGFHEYEVALSVRDPEQRDKYIGSDEAWEMAEGSLEMALEKRALPHAREVGEAVFYGPKIDLKIKDALGRAWQCTTIQFDFNLPDRFDLTFIGPDGREHRPYMVHRALLGSLERFLGVLIEHYAGAFPVWLAPVQVVVIPIADRHSDYAQQVAVQLRKAGVRVEVDARSETVAHKIAEAETRKVPFMLIVGDREVAKGTVSVRERGMKDHGPMKVEEVQALLGK
ncbi:MAG TPA: threonine--tRNA ligase, partial [Armatimonadetes bacterium]|nr:threonine--tRNA ligase [Armatimonadota bacterium]